MAKSKGKNDGMLVLEEDGAPTGEISPKKSDGKAQAANWDKNDDPKHPQPLVKRSNNFLQDSSA